MAEMAYSNTIAALNLLKTFWDVMILHFERPIQIIEKYLSKIYILHAIFKEISREKYSMSPPPKGHGFT